MQRELRALAKSRKLEIFLCENRGGYIERNVTLEPGNVAIVNVAPGNVVTNVTLAPNNVAPGNVATGNVATGNVATGNV